MDNSKNKLSFKQFLDKSTNLITLVGIFNALFIFSTSLKSTEVAGFLLVFFFLISLFMWYELILFTIKSSDGSWKYDMFFYLLCAIVIGQLWYFIILFASILIMIAIYGSVALLIFLIAKFLIWIIRKRLEKLKENKRKIVIMIVILISLTITLIIIKIAGLKILSLLSVVLGVFI